MENGSGGKQSCGQGVRDVPVWNVPAVGTLCCSPWAALDLNSRQNSLPRSISRKAFVYFANSPPGKHLFIYMFYLCDK